MGPSRPEANALPAQADLAFCVGEGSPLAGSIGLCIVRLLHTSDVFAAVCLAVRPSMDSAKGEVCMSGVLFMA